MMPKNLYTHGLILLAVLLAGCTAPGETSTIPPAASPTPAATITPAPTPIPSATMPPGPGGMLAALDRDGQIHILNLASGEESPAAEAGRELVGWSPSGGYLLAQIDADKYAVFDSQGEQVYASDSLPQAPAWVPGGQADQPGDWLAVAEADGALVGMQFPTLNRKEFELPGTLGADGLATLAWAADGQLAYTPSLAQMENKVSFAGNEIFTSLAANGVNSQPLAVWDAKTDMFTGGGTISPDYTQTYYQMIGPVAGGDPPLALALAIPGACNSCTIDGLSLVSIETNFDRIIDLGTTLLMSSEAYAWNPVQPGLLALASGGSRYTFISKKLVLLDLQAGTLSDLSGEDITVYEPSWSPDGLRLAYTQMPAKQVDGSAAELEAALGGRAIAIYDLKRGESRLVTQPDAGSIDGWPRWSADGSFLLYARKSLADNTTQVRTLDLSSGEDRPVFTLDNAPQACHLVACDWDQMLAYASGSTPVPAAGQTVLAPTPAASLAPDPDKSDWNTYTLPGYGFTLHFPATWQVDDELVDLHFVQLKQGTLALTIGFKRPLQNVNITRTGVAAGDFEDGGTATFLGQSVRRRMLVYQNKTKAVLYQSAAEVEAGGLVFSLSLDDSARHYEDIDIPPELQKEADQIIASLTLDQPRP